MVKWQRIIYAQQMSPKEELQNVPYSTILDKNVKKNAPCMFNFRLLPFKPGSLKILTPPPPKKTILKGDRNISAPDLTTLTREGWGEGPPSC